MTLTDKPGRDGMTKGTQVWRLIVFAFIGVAAFFAARDLVVSIFGVRDPNAIAHPEPGLYLPLYAVERLLMLVIALIVALRRPGSAAARTLTEALTGMASNNYFDTYSPDDFLIWPARLLNFAGVPYGMAQFVRFTSTCTDGDRFGIRTLTARLAPMIGVWMGCWGFLKLFIQFPELQTLPAGLDWLCQYVTSHKTCYAIDFARLIDPLHWGGWAFGYMCVMASSLAGLASASPADRPRMHWVVATGLASLGTITHAGDRLFHGGVEHAWANQVDAIAQAALPLGLGYVILKHRFLDIVFILNRALVYGVLTWIVLTLFSGAEIVSHTLVSRLLPAPVNEPPKPNLFGSPIQFVVALGVILSYRRLESKVEHVIATVFFRDRRDREARLRAFVRNTEHFNDPQTLLQRLVDTIEKNARVDTVALYKKNPRGDYESVHDPVAPELPAVDRDDPSVVDMRTTLGPVIVVEGSALPGSVAFPMLVRGGLTGFVVCGNRDEAYDPEETEAVFQAVRATGIALEELRMDSVEQRIADVERRLVESQVYAQRLETVLANRSDRSEGSRGDRSSERDQPDKQV